MAPKSKTKNSNTTSEKQEKPTVNLAGMFEFYARIVKLDILRNNHSADVVSKYSTWLNRLHNHSNDKVKYDYVKLLVMGLKHPNSVCPFNEYPPAEIEPIEEEWITAARKIFFQTEPECQVVSLNPPIVTAVSEDKREFAAYQMIPKMGLQCFYARSDEPLQEWIFKHNSLSKQPENAVQAIPLDWERSLAGIHRKQIENSPSKRTSSMRNPDPCIILDTPQENLKTDADKFLWNDKSLLTGDTIPGSEQSVDWLIHEHERTQLEIDEEMIRSFDKVFPESFQVIADPKFLEEIISKLDGTEECKINSMDTDNCENIDSDPCKATRKNGIKCQVSKDDCLHRQSAGYDRNSVSSRPYTENNFSATRQCDLIMENILEPTVMSVEERNNDGTKLSENYKDLLKDYVHPQTILEHLKYDLNKCSKSLPSFSEAASSFDYLASKAENTMRDVNNWLKYKNREC